MINVREMGDPCPECGGTQYVCKCQVEPLINACQDILALHPDLEYLISEDLSLVGLYISFNLAIKALRSALAKGKG